MIRFTPKLLLFLIMPATAALGMDLANPPAEEAEAYSTFFGLVHSQITIRILVIFLVAAMLMVLYQILLVRRSKTAYIYPLEKKSLKSNLTGEQYYTGPISPPKTNQENHDRTIPNPSLTEPLYVMEDRVFIRNQGKLIKILLDDIWYVEAERNYSKIVTEEKSYTVVSSLKGFTEKIQNRKFLRVHRSFLVNITKLDAIAETHLEINRKVIPLSHIYKEELFRMLKKI
jgi:DNA-binding LytR/AlgR family response regulator